MRNGGAREPTGDRIKLVDRGPYFGKSGDGLLGDGVLWLDRLHRPTAPSGEFSLDEAAEIGRD